MVGEIIRNILEGCDEAVSIGLFWLRIGKSGGFS
jgi:hypothetical protein